MPVSLLFSGHMVDLPDRKEPRFPASLEKAVEKRVAAAVSPYAKLADVAGFASAARGADIIFHEQCRAVGIPTTVIIPFSPEKFVGESVVDQNWEARFWRLWDETPDHKRDAMMLTASDEAFQLCNIELLKRAVAYGNIHLIAFWDRERGDGPGGTGSLIELTAAPASSDIFTPQDVATAKPEPKP
jgi:hypothetical protein